MVKLACLVGKAKFREREKSVYEEKFGPMSVLSRLNMNAIKFNTI